MIFANPENEKFPTHVVTIRTVKERVEARQLNTFIVGDPAIIRGRPYRNIDLNWLIDKTESIIRLMKRRQSRFVQLVRLSRRHTEKRVPTGIHFCRALSSQVAFKGRISWKGYTVLDFLLPLGTLSREVL